MNCRHWPACGCDEGCEIRIENRSQFSMVEKILFGAAIAILAIAAVLFWRLG